MTDIAESDRIGEFPHPRERSELIGQDRALTTLRRSLTSGRMPHAWLFAGPRGIGKATTAYRFARYLLKYGASGGGPVDLGMDPNDPVFRKVAAQSHGDLAVVRRPWDHERKRLKAELPVDEVRKLGNFFGRHSAEGGMRVAIVDSADDMNRNAANALLKILEEPPAGGAIILIAHAPGGLLPTIRSRCRRLAFQPLNEESVSRALGDMVPSLSDSDATTLARLSNGSLARALELASGGGLELFDQLIAAVSAQRADIGALHALAERLARPTAEQNYRAFLELLTDWLRRVAAGTPTGERDASTVARLRVRGLDRWVRAWDKVRALSDQADALNLDRRFVILSAFNEIDAAAR